MNRWWLVLAGFAALFSPDSASLAQEGPPKAAKRENMEYYTAVYWDFNPGKEREALEFAQKHFVPVSSEAGQKSEIAFLPLSGEWDAIVYFPLPDGPDAYAWETTPADAAWLAKFAEREGGWDKAVKLFQQYDEMVARSKSELVMHPTGP
jgi:hypothetical protein